MGNQAFIVPKHSNVGIYVHWNGGRGSVEGFLKYARAVWPHAARCFGRHR